MIPALNEEAFIGNLLESLTRQSYRNFEVVVVDSQSDDRTCEVAETYGERRGYDPEASLPSRRAAAARWQEP